MSPFHSRENRSLKESRQGHRACRQGSHDPCTGQQLKSLSFGTVLAAFPTQTLGSPYVMHMSRLKARHLCVPPRPWLEPLECGLGIIHLCLLRPGEDQGTLGKKVAEGTFGRIFPRPSYTRSSPTAKRGAEARDVLWVLAF